MNLDARAAHPAFEPAGDGQDRVADGLGLQPADEHPVQESVVRVPGLRLGRRVLAMRNVLLRTSSRTDP